MGKKLDSTPIFFHQQRPRSRTFPALFPSPQRGSQLHFEWSVCLCIFLRHSTSAFPFSRVVSSCDLNRLRVAALLSPGPRLSWPATEGTWAHWEGLSPVPGYSATLIQPLRSVRKGEWWYCHHLPWVRSEPEDQWLWGKLKMQNSKHTLS